jgi:hypothetical protein
MYRLFLILLVGILIISSCDNNEHTGFTISGTINNGAGQMIYLDILSENKIERFDSAEIKEDNTFIIQNFVSTKEFFLLKLSESNFVYLLVDSLDNMIVNGESDNLLLTYQVENSDDSKLLKEVNLHNYSSRQRVDSLNRVFNAQKQTENFDSLKKHLDSIYFDIYKNEREFLINFIEKNSTSLASFMASISTNCT